MSIKWNASHAVSIVQRTQGGSLIQHLISREYLVELKSQLERWLFLVEECLQNKEIK